MNRFEALQIADEYYLTSEEHLNKYEYVKAIQYADSAMELFAYFEEYYKMCKTLNLKGKIISAQGNETASLEKYLEGLEIAEEYGFNDMISVFYNNIGFRYDYIDQYDKALDYFKKSYVYFKKIDKNKSDYINRLGMILNLNFFDIYVKQDKVELMEKHLSKFKHYLYKDNNISLIESYKEAVILRDGYLALMKNQLEVVNKKIEELMASVNEHLDDEAIWDEFPSLIEFLLDSKNYKEAEYIINEYEFKAEKIKDIDAVINALKYKIKLLKELERIEEYKETCAKYYEYWEDKDVLNRQEKAYALDFKIAIRKIDAARKKAENLLEIDSLTKIKNRYSLYKEARESFVHAYVNKKRIILGILDVDSFKEINAEIGHVGGDMALKTVASKISKAIVGYGTVYRLGGDEFVVVFKDIEAYEVKKIAIQIKEELKRIPINISQGYIRFCPKEDEVLDDVIKRADRLLYDVKDNGKDSFMLVDEDC